jgi:hypothetical protein
VGEHLTQSANDKQEVTPALQEIQETTSKVPDVMSLDNGYMSGSNLEAFNETAIDAYIATGKGESKDKRSLDESNREIKKSDFTYDTERDCFICPTGHTLELRNRTGDDKKTYQDRGDSCDQCCYRSRCCKSKKGEPRIITTDDKEPLRQKMVEKMNQESSQEIYKERKAIVEPVFGQIKKNIGFRGFSVRGFIKARGEFSLVCAAYNIKKVVKSIGYAFPRLKQGKGVPVVA